MIEMWKNYDCLFNPKNKYYHNKQARHDVFCAIAEKLKVFNPSLGPADVKNKMQYLRGQYTRELSKIKDIRNCPSADDSYAPTAFWFKKLYFLQDFVKTRKGIGGNVLEQNSSLFEDSCESSQLLESYVSPKQHIKRARMDDDTPVSRRSINQEESVLEPAVNAFHNFSNTMNTSVNEKDEAFCNFIKGELSAITNVSIKDELVETITLSVFEAKKKQQHFFKRHLTQHLEVAQQNESASSNVKTEQDNIEFEDTNVEHAYEETFDATTNSSKRDYRTSTHDNMTITKNDLGQSAEYFNSHQDENPLPSPTIFQQQPEPEPFESYHTTTTTTTKAIDMEDKIEDVEDLINIEDELDVIQNLMPRSKESMQLQDELSKVQTEYYRNKAAYFGKLTENSKIKRTLMLLQSRKLQLEIEKQTN